MRELLKLPTISDNKVAFVFRSGTDVTRSSTMRFILMERVEKADSMLFFPQISVVLFDSACLDLYLVCEI